MLLTNVEAVRDVSAAFLEYDGGAKGYLTRHELRAAHLALFGFQPSTIEMDALLPKLRDGGPMGLDLPGFCSAMVPRLCTQDADELSRRTFRAFDTERRGYISFADFSRAMRHVAPHLPHETIDLVFSQVDSDGDGRVRWRRTSRPAHTRALSQVRAYRLSRARSYQDFHSMMCARPGQVNAGAPASVHACNQRERLLRRDRPAARAAY